MDWSGKSFFYKGFEVFETFDIFNFFSQCGNDYDFHYKTPHKYLTMSEYIDSLDSNRFIQKFVEELIIDGTVNALRAVELTA